MRVRFETTAICDWKSFHAAFARVMGFPDFYGANMDAWIDCMSDLRDPQYGMTSIHVGADELLELEVVDSGDFISRQPEQFSALVECTAFINRVRFLDEGRPPVISLVLV